MHCTTSQTVRLAQRGALVAECNKGNDTCNEHVVIPTQAGIKRVVQGVDVNANFE